MSDIEKYFDYIGKTLRPTTCQTYFWALAYYKLWLASIGKKDDKEVVQKDMYNLMEFIEKKLKPKSRNVVIAAVRKYFQWLNMTGIYEQSITNGLKPFKSKNRPKSLSIEEYREIEHFFFDNSKKRMLLKLMRFSGLRVTEACAVQKRNIKFEDDFAIIYNVKGKGGEVTSAFFVPKISGGTIGDYEEFKAYVSKQTGRIFGEWEKNITSRWIWDAAKQIGIKFTAHAMRHSFAFGLLQNEVPVYKIAQFLRHKSSRVTEEIYLKTNQNIRNKYMTEVIKELTK